MHIDLLWTIPSGNPAGYQVQWSADDETAWTAVSPSHEETSTHYSHNRVKAIRNHRELSRWSRQTSAVATVTPDTGTPANSPATEAPAISGTAQVGETLTADTFAHHRQRRAEQHIVQLSVTRFC